MHKPIHTIEAVAQEITRSLDIIVYAIDGLYEKTVRENLTPRGIGEFYRAAGSLMVTTLQAVLVKLSNGRTALEASLSDSERTFLNAYADSELQHHDAHEALWGVFQQVRATYMKRLREVAAARAFGTDTFNPEPRVMTRNGRRWNFSDYAYLTVRGMLVNWYNEAKIGYIASINGTEFVLDTEDPTLLDMVYKVEDYPVLSDVLFHPRTSKLVGGIYVST